MKLAKKIIGFKIIIITFCLTAAASANASGFIFNWDLFVVNPALSLGKTGNEVLVKDLSISDVSMPITTDSREAFSLPSNQNNVSTPSLEKKSVLENIKLNFSPASEFMPNRREMYPHSDDEQISKLMNAVTSFIYDDSKIRSLENIGRIIEPQINFYFKF
jgi:hypothetical protein